MIQILFDGGAGGNFLSSLLDKKTTKPSVLNEYTVPNSVCELTHDPYPTVADQIIVIKNSPDSLVYVKFLMMTKRCLVDYKYRLPVTHYNIKSITDWSMLDKDTLNKVYDFSEMPSQIRKLKNECEDYGINLCSLVSMRSFIRKTPIEKTLGLMFNLDNKFLQRLIRKGRERQDKFYNYDYIIKLNPNKEIVVIDYDDIFIDINVENTLFHAYKKELISYTIQNYNAIYKYIPQDIINSNDQLVSYLNRIRSLHIN